MRLANPLAVYSETITCRINPRTISSNSRGHLTYNPHSKIRMLIPVLIAVIEFKWIPPGPLMFASGIFVGNSILKLMDADVGFCSDICFQFSGSSRSWYCSLGEFFVSLRFRRMFGGSLRFRRMSRDCRLMAVLRIVSADHRTTRSRRDLVLNERNLN